MILIIIGLAIVGFVFPPAWLALLGYGIYIFASRKSRRSDAVESRVKKMVAAGKEMASFSDLYFEAARAYAIEKGAKAAEPNAASAHILVDGTRYFVVFSRAASGGTMISVEESDAVKRRIFDKPMEDFLKKSATSTLKDNTFYVGGFAFVGDAASDEVGANIVNKITAKVLELSPTELDIYRYLMEEADRISKGGDLGRATLENTGITPLEYEGEMAKAHKYLKNRAALNYLNDEVTPDLEEVLSEDQSDNIRTMIFALIIHSNTAGVNSIRKKYAVHYANNCTQNGHFRFADKWDDVINSIP